MAFTNVRGLRGKVYQPEPSQVEFQKHPCKDCYSCQRCSDDRCRMCCGGQHQKNCHNNKKDETNLSDGGTQ